MWIERDISASLQANKDPIQILRGPRQCGKTSLLLHLDKSFTEVSLDDPSLRHLAQTDPELLLKQFESQKLLIDEAQYAPELFPSLKRRVDLLKRKSDFRPQTILRLTGSNQILMDKNVKESLAGRASFFDLNTLSVAEILQSQAIPIQHILFRGGWPELYVRPDLTPQRFLDNYINSYVEKDIVLAGGIQKSRDFLRFVQLLAGRVSQVLDQTELSKEVGVDAKTIKGWVSVLERMHIVRLLSPFSSNLSKRLVKSPKIYFIDSGLACRLQGWTAPEPILTSPQQGALFENLVFSEIYKLNLNFQLGWPIFYWRSREGEEVDFLIQKNPKEFVFIEAKVSSQRAPTLEAMPEIRKVFKKAIPQVVVCYQEGAKILGDQVPIALLKDWLLRSSAQRI